MKGFICGPRLYRYEGWFFEVHSWCGPHPLKKDGELRKRVGRRFWAVWNRFAALSDKQKARYRIGGGCREI